MDFAPSARAADLAARVRAFVDTEIEPVEPGILRDVAARRARGEDAWPPPAVVADLQAKARSQGLWNLFLPAGHGDAYAARFGTDGGTGLTNTDYASIAEQTGRSAAGPAGVQLQRPRHRQHGGAAALRLARAAAGVARAAARRRGCAAPS